MGFNPGGGGGGGSPTAASDKYLVGDALTDGSIRMIGTNGMFQLQKRVAGVWETMIESAPTETIIAESVKTGVGSFHLGDVHSIGSAGENVIFKNEKTGVSWFPVWQGVSTDGVTVMPPASRIYQAKVASLPVGATAATTGQIDYSFQTTFAVNTSVFSVKIVAAETYVGKGAWRVVYTTGEEVAFFQFDINCAPGTIIDIPLKYPLDARAGAVVNVTITKADGTLLKVRASSTQPTQPWRELAVRVFTDSVDPVDYNVAYEYQAGSKATYYGIPVIASGNVPAGTTFAWGQSGATWKPNLTDSSYVWRGVWGVSAAYVVGDIVSAAGAGNQLWLCTVAHTSTTSPSNLIGADIGKWQQRMYGGPGAQMVPPKVTRFTSSGTWTPSAGMVYAIAEVQAGGGSGAAITSTGLVWAAGGGSSGVYAKVMMTAAQAGASQAITVGSAGALATVQGAGNAGGASSIGSVVSCQGGQGGNGFVQGAATAYAVGAPAVGNAPTISGATLIDSSLGQASSYSSAGGSTGFLFAGGGGSSRMGLSSSVVCSQGQDITAVTVQATGTDQYGAGGGGTAGYGNNGLRVGTVGRQGIVIITEYFQ